MMNHIVPEFEADEDYLFRELPKKSTMGGDEDIMELLWQNGQVVMQSQNQRSVGNKKPEIRASMANPEIRSSVVEEETGPSDLFMHEDEMSSWLHYPVDENSLEGYLYSNDLLYPTPPSSAHLTTASTSPPPPPPSVTIPPPRPPVPQFRRVEGESGQPKYTNFLHFSRPNKGRTPQLGPASTSKLPPALKPSTVAESNDTPAAEALESRVSRVSDKAPTVSAANIGGGGNMSGVGAAGTSSAGRELETCELSVTSSPGTGGSGASASVEPSSQPPPPPTDDRKRKGRDTDDTECHSEDVEFEYPDAKKQSHGATSTKRSRAAEVHNLSERRRRDRINEKMKALQELIPRCNKSDKASMLDEAIEYLKSLQMQVQMMSMGCSMVPMMFPGVQQYMSPMGMGMDMGMNHAIVPYPPILPGSSLPNPAAAVAAAAAQLGQRFPVPGFNMSPPVTIMGGPAASQAANLSAPMMSSFPPHNQNQPRAPNFADPFQQYLGLHQTQLPHPQNQGGMPPIATNKPSSSKDPTNQTG
ncbi:hypothetical protein L6452_43037 [Arctium lappa]|uniref:Uncharacterized protein n=1 Tax=Arctium lappa TaxID=4217 RepID=A0ACB8XP19_ARCLA|nr:hypothetical protein L6452_43037 [Arctium lappa]